MVLLAALLAALQAEGPSADLRRGDLKVSENRRFLVHADGTPFFWLGDTAWELFHRLNREEAERYLEDRRRKRFTVIQAVALAELEGLTVPNPYGHRPLLENDPARPDVRDGPENDYWDHVDWILRRAEEKGIFIGLLPTWGDKVTKAWGVGPVVFTPENALAYGRWIGARYKDRPNVVWILGGDRNPDGKLDLWRAMAKGIKEGDGGRHLMTYHCQGGASSSKWFHGDEWLDFNMLQSGHNYNVDNYSRIAADYARTPAKPCLDGEPRYEDHPAGFKAANGYMDDYDSRQAAYWALFAGAHGHTYGCHDLWQMYAEGRKPISVARTYWPEALDLPGAGDMRHVRALMESRPFLSRVPDPGLVAGDAGKGADHVRATRGDGYAFVYVPTGKPLTVALGRISGDSVAAWWFDPREGTHLPVGTFVNSGTRDFTPPSSGRGHDWVLVLDDASRRLEPLGARGNRPPSVSLSVPPGPFTAPAAIELSAAAADADGTVAKVEYIAGATKLGEGARFTWKAEARGVFSVTARATDDRGATAVSAPLRVEVGPLEFVFFRGVNLNGAAVTIDGNAWEGKEAAGVSYTGSAFENPGVKLDPPADEARAGMIRSSVWNPQGSNVTLKGIPDGPCRVWLYVWEDNQPATFDVLLQGARVAEKVASGPAGRWQKLGPWTAEARDGALRVTCSPGDANLSGIEVWRLK